MVNCKPLTFADYMQATAAELAAMLGGTVEGDASRRVHTVAKIEEAGDGALAFLANPKYEEYLYKTKASAVLVRRDQEMKGTVTATLIRVDDPYLAFTMVLEEAARRQAMAISGIEQPSHIDPTATLGQNCFVGAFAYISAGCKIGNNVKIHPQVYIGPDTVIGDDCIVYPGAKIYHQIQIGNRCIIHSNAVIGADGFGHAPQPDGSYRKIPQLGIVVLEDDVEVGANTTIDRATIGETRIGKGTKLDNLIQIAHNVEIGQHVVIAAQAGISGSNKIGSYCQIGGQVGMAGHIRIAPRNRLGGRTGVVGSITEEGQNLLGTPAMDAKEYFKQIINIKNLPQLEARLRVLERQWEQYQRSHE